MSKRPRLLDLYSGAGGAARGYQMAGFHVTGIDITAQPRYAGDVFVQADALEYVAEHGHEYDAIHASPPCQAFVQTGMYDRSKHPDLLTPTRTLLLASERPYVIENVPGAPMRRDLILCGTMFGLLLRRHRWFESNVPMPLLVPPCAHTGREIGVYGHPRGTHAKWGRGTLADWGPAMGISWMGQHGLSQAIPPAYTRLIGEALLNALEARYAVAI